MPRTINSSWFSLWAWLSPQADEVLLERYVDQHDQAAFTALVHRHAHLVFGICRHILPDPVDAEDAVQATFLILSQRASSVRKKSSLKSWLHGVALRVSKTLLRKQARYYRRERLAARRAFVASPIDLLAESEVRDALRGEVALLPERYRLPIELCYWHGQSREEIAETLGWSPGMVKGQLERAKRRLRARLAQRGIQVLLPVGLGISALGALTLLPMLASAANSASHASATLVTGLRAASFVGTTVHTIYRVLQTTRGAATIALIMTTLGFLPSQQTDPPQDQDQRLCIEESSRQPQPFKLPPVNSPDQD